MKGLIKDVFPSKACNYLSHFINVRHDIVLKKVTEYWNELTNWHVNAKYAVTAKHKIDEQQDRFNSVYN